MSKEPLSFIGITFRLAPVFSHNICQGTILLWCSKAETIISSPFFNSEEKPLATKLILCVVPEVKMIFMFNVDKIRADFPILKRTVHGKPLVYFDNAATSQTPQIVIDAIVDYYSNYNANIHRGVHTLSQEATDKYEEARIKIQQHFNAKEAYEIIFT
jgi:hypothetical protein